MSWLDWLKNLFPNLRNVNLKVFSEIKIGHFVNIRKKTIVDKRTLVINWQQLSLKEKNKLLKNISSSVQSEINVLEEGFKDRADDYLEKINTEENQGFLKYFIGKIPDGDISILKACLYLRSVLKSGGETGRIKEDIVKRYGVRGRNISNLCSAGYFESWIKPLYQEMSRLVSFDLEKFRKIYDEIVSCYPFALFVHRSMKYGEVKEEIAQKIKTIKKYGIQSLNIHGIGVSNVGKIRRAVEEFEKEAVFEKTIEEFKNIIVVRLIFFGGE